MMAARTILRGADSIRFLASHGITFTLPYGQTKDSMPKGWNLPGAGVGADEAIAHYQQRNNVGGLAEHVIFLDRDYNFPATVAELGDLARTAKVWRDNASDRGALIYRLVDGPVQSATWIPEGETNPHFELLAQTKTGNYRQKNVVGHHKGGEYCIVDAQLGIKEITRADLALIWLVVTSEELHAPKPTKTHTATPTERKPGYGQDDLVAQVKAHWTPLAVFEHHGWVKDGIEQDRSGEMRILGHGGLLIKNDGLWFNHSEQVGGDSVDAWARCIRRDRDRYFVEIIEEMADAAGIQVPHRHFRQGAAPLPEGAKVLDNGTIVLKTTPTPERPKRPAPPVLTPTVVERLGDALRGPVATRLLEGMSNREMYRNVLIQLVTVIAPEMGGWVFDADQRWLGEKLGKSGMSAGRNMKKLDAANHINYLHTGKTEDGKVGHPKMRIDLQPLIAALWESCANVTNNKKQENTMFVTFRNDSPTNVHATYSGAGKYADASMRTLYKFAVKRTGHPTVLARSLTSSALMALDYLTRNKEATRAELAEGTGMSAGSVAGGTRVLEQLGLVSVEWDGPGTPKIYVLRPDWEAHLQATIPHMTSYGARIRLVIRTYDERIEYIDWQIKCAKSPAAADDLRQHKKGLECTRKKWCVYGNKVGAYGRQVEATPPW